MKGRCVGRNGSPDTCNPAQHSVSSGSTWSVWRDPVSTRVGGVGGMRKMLKVIYYLTLMVSLCVGGVWCENLTIFTFLRHCIDVQNNLKKTV